MFGREFISIILRNLPSIQPALRDVNRNSGRDPYPKISVKKYMSYKIAKQRFYGRAAKEANAALDTPPNTSENSLMTPNRPPEKLPDPWLFDTEKLLRELARCREIMLNVPINDPHATHFGVNMAIDTISQLEQTIRYLLRLHREGQTRFTGEAEEIGLEGGVIFWKIRAKRSPAPRA